LTYSILIPARFASQRLPGKPLLDIAGRPMIQHVCERASATTAERVVVATDDQRIFDAVKDFGGEAVMTAVDHPSGTDRLAEVANFLELPDDHIVVNLQGDEPMLPMEAIEQVAKNLQTNTECGIATLCEKIDSNADIHNPNAVKVVRDNKDIALYFSRSSIPYLRDKESSDWRASDNYWYRHLGIYAYRVKVLRDFVLWGISELERIERLEQLRALYNGVKIHCEEACVAVPAGVDTREELEKIRQLFT
jgi:3-deoxy-manno-octulosonate cytidylyltransferase (CMP-KDO synthetase)